MELITGSNARPMGSFDDRDDWDPTATAISVGGSLAGMQTDANAVEAMETDALIEVVQPTPQAQSVVSVQVQARPPAPDATVTEETMQGSSASSNANSVTKVSPRKVQLQALTATKTPFSRIKPQEIDCAIVKWPAAVLMQNVEGFLVNTRQRELWLGSRRNAAGKDLTADL